MERAFFVCAVPKDVFWVYDRCKWVEAVPDGIAISSQGSEYCDGLFEMEQKLDGHLNTER